MRVDVGRTLLTRAHLERRRRRAAAARAALETAEGLFAEIHATAWLEQVRGELARGAGTAPSGSRTLLTETEARVAAEVARGASNREIAERLYVSVKTVEATLTRIYRKLEVRSRTQLAARLTATPPSLSLRRRPAAPTSVELVETTLAALRLTGFRRSRDFVPQSRRLLYLAEPTDALVARRCPATRVFPLPLPYRQFLGSVRHSPQIVACHPRWNNRTSREHHTM